MAVRLHPDHQFVVSKDGWIMEELKRRLRYGEQLETPLMELPECYEKLGLRFDDEELFKQKLEEIGKPLSDILEGNLIDHFYFKLDSHSEIPLLPSFDTNIKIEKGSSYSLFDDFYDNKLPTYEVFVDSEHADPEIKKRWKVHYPAYLRNFKTLKIQEKKLHQLIRKGLNRFFKKECSEPKIKDQIHSITGDTDNTQLLRYFLEMVQDGNFEDSGLPPSRKMATLLHEIENPNAPPMDDDFFSSDDE